jgi:hypothetical protein
MISTKQWVTLTAVWLAVTGHAAFAQSRETTTPTRAANVAQLLNDLRWHDTDSREHYLQIREERTQRLLREIDGLIAETLSSRSATPTTLQAGLDALLGHKRGDLQQSAAFLVTLPVGRFLVIGVEVTRGGGAIPENAFSFRAYRDNGTSFAFVSAIDFPPGDLSGNELDDWSTNGFLQVKSLLTRPVRSEFWFLEWGIVSSAVPPIVMMRLVAFDGDHFRIVWAPKNFEAESPVTLTVDGFTTHKLFDPIGGAAGSPTVVINERYALTVDGPQKIGEWKEPRR